MIASATVTDAAEPATDAGTGSAGGILVVGRSSTTLTAGPLTSRETRQEKFKVYATYTLNNFFPRFLHLYTFPTMHYLATLQLGYFVVTIPTAVDSLL